MRSSRTMSTSKPKTAKRHRDRIQGPTEDQVNRVIGMIDRATPDQPALSETIQAMAGVSERQLRQIVETARRNGQLICNGVPGGYFKART